MGALAAFSVFVLIFSQVHGRAVTTETSEPAPNAQDLSSPQYLYMEYLRVTKGGADPNDGTLLATSFKDTCKFVYLYTKRIH